MDPAASLEHTNVMQLNMHCCFMSKRVFFWSLAIYKEDEEAANSCWKLKSVHLFL